jgi:integrase
MALMAGLRISEICNMKVKDIDFRSNTIRIENSKNPNRGIEGYGTDRIVKLKKEAMPPIKAWVDYIGNTSKWVVPSDKSPDQPLRKKSLHERFRAYLAQAGMGDESYKTEYIQLNHGKKKPKSRTMYKYHFHCFRHTMASYIYHHSGDIYLVNQFLGHKQLDTTMVYAKLTPIKMTKAINKAFSCLEENYVSGRHIQVQQPIIEAKPEPKPIQQVDHTQSMLLAEKKRIISQMSAGEITREECQHMLENIKDVSSFI